MWAQICEPEANCKLGGTARKDTQSDGVFGKRPIKLILYRAPVIAAMLSATNLSFAISRLAFSGVPIFWSSKRANAAAAGTNHSYLSVHGKWLAGVVLRLTGVDTYSALHRIVNSVKCDHDAKNMHT